jgi:hypothetical protein
MASLDRKVAALQTTDAVQVSAFTFAVADDTVVSITAKVTALQSGQGTGKSFWLFGSARKAGAAAAVLLGAALAIVTAQGDAGAVLWDAVIDLSSPNLRIRVTGVAATTINWLVSVDIHVAP